MNKKNSVILVFSIFFSVFILLTISSNNKALNQNFKGITEKVYVYGGKGNIKIHLETGEEYHLDLYSVKSNDNLSVGDSLFKAKGDYVLYHFKKDSLNNFFLYKTHKYTTFFD